MSAKNALQEHLQRNKQPLPSYTTKRLSNSPDHAAQFQSMVHIGSDHHVQGPVATTKTAAQQGAAAAALELLIRCQATLAKQIATPIADPNILAARQGADQATLPQRRVEQATTGALSKPIIAAVTLTQGPSYQPAVDFTALLLINLEHILLPANVNFVAGCWAIGFLRKTHRLAQPDLPQRLRGLLDLRVTDSDARDAADWLLALEAGRLCGALRTARRSVAFHIVSQPHAAEGIAKAIRQEDYRAACTVQHHTSLPPELLRAGL